MLPSKQFTRIDKRVFVNEKLTDGAKVLYGYLAGLKSGQNFSDTYLLKALGISKTVLARRKKELTDAGLILVEQMQPRVYVLYIGYTSMSAADVKFAWETAEDEVVD